MSEASCAGYPGEQPHYRPQEASVSFFVLNSIELFIQSKQSSVRKQSEFGLLLSF